MIEAALKSLLTADAGVSALVGTRVYPLAAPQGDVLDSSGNVLPWIGYQLITANHTMSMGGLSGLCKALLQLSVRATSYDSVKATVDAVRTCLAGYKGTVGGVVIQAILPGDDRDLPYEAPVAGKGLGVCHTASDYAVWYAE